MALYTYSWIGFDSVKLIDELPDVTPAKIAFGPVAPALTKTFTSLVPLTPDEEKDIDNSLKRQGWIFVSKV